MCANAFVIVITFGIGVIAMYINSLGICPYHYTPVTHTRAQTQSFEVHEVVHEALVR